MACLQSIRKEITHRKSSSSLSRFLSKVLLVCRYASYQAISYILGQKDEKNRAHVKSYRGRSLNKSERNLCIIDLEGLALVDGIRHFKVQCTYIPLRQLFTVYSDHQVLRSLKINEATGRLGCWAIFLQGFFSMNHTETW